MCKTFFNEENITKCTFNLCSAWEPERGIKNHENNMGGVVGVKESESIPFFFCGYDWEAHEVGDEKSRRQSHTCTVTELHRGGDTRRARQLTSRECEMREGNKTPDKVQNCGDKLRN